MEKFDLIDVPLAGANLLEASAGTGKTYNIEGLFLRLVIETALPVGAILVVTYTVAATEELRERIRCRLAGAALAFACGESEDPLLAALVAKFPDLRERRRVLGLLQAARRDFDEAAIFTIHSFCQKTLQENAFESDALFDTELITDERHLRGEIVDDFWRSHFYETLPEVAGYALASGLSPAYFSELLGKAISHQDVEIIPSLPPPRIETIREHLSAYNEAFGEIAAAWPGVRDEVRGILEGPALHAGTYGRKAAALCQRMECSFNSGGPFFPLDDHFSKFTPAYLAGKTKKNHAPPEHHFFQRCQEIRDRAAVLEQALDEYLLFLKRDFLVTAAKRLAARKRKDNIMFFDDLLVRLRAALAARGGEQLAGIIRTKYRAALIDEFQDTDPVQFAIFRTLFESGEHPLFLIGDPKQAIYSFRGADIFAYMKAAADIPGKYTISENWRSEPGLIQAVNTIFSQRDNPFVYPAISFFPTTAPREKRHTCLTIPGPEKAPCQWWFVPAEKYGEPGKPLPKGRARRIIAHAVAGETARLLTLASRGEAMIGDNPLEAGDIAVLVRQHREARLIQEALRQLNIPAVLQKAGNIFDTGEAEELERILRGLARPEEEGLVRAALLTDIFGVGVAEMGRLNREERDWGTWLEKFGFYHRLWRETGFMSMFTALLAGEEIKPRLLAFPDGERRVTNLLHLAELLLQAGDEGRLGAAGLVKWLAQQRDPTTPRLDEHQLRLESDSRAVQIVTVHQSKGLEYPVVFCPFTWEGAEVRGDAFPFHDAASAGQIVFDLGSPDAARHRSLAERELLAENLRLLYVALTRARHRCYFVWGRFRQAETSAPAYLFHDGPGTASPGNEAALTAALAANYEKLDDTLMYNRLAEIANQAGGNIDLREIPAELEVIQSLRPEEKSHLAFKDFTGKIDRSWRIVSYSSLVADQPQAAEFPDYDGSLTTDDASAADNSEASGLPGEKSLRAPTGAEDIFSFPRGAAAGTLLHDILQHLDFQEERKGELSSLVSGKLASHGFASRWEDVLMDLLKKVVTVPFLPFADPDSPSQPFTLAAVANAARLNELEFYFPLQPLTPADLGGLFGQTGISLSQPGTGQPAPDLLAAKERLHFSPLRGFMKGFMDMVFWHDGRYYLLDWKSNFLGRELGDYAPDGLARAMAEGAYYLQYHLYTLALHQYLAARLPDYRYERHFGGIYYVFLRGLDPAAGPQYGIFRDRPPAALIAELVGRLIAPQQTFSSAMLRSKL